MIEVYERGRGGGIYNLCSQDRRSPLQAVRAVVRNLGLKARKIRKRLGRRWRLTPFDTVIELMRADFITRNPLPLI